MNKHLAGQWRASDQTGHKRDLGGGLKGRNTKEAESGGGARSKERNVKETERGGGGGLKTGRDTKETKDVTGGNRVLKMTRLSLNLIFYIVHKLY